MKASMNRRTFLQRLLCFPLIFWWGTSLWANGGKRSFGYYQGLGPNEKRDPRRTDGTYSNMPLISWADIQAGVEKTYNFWHGHGAQHQFTLTESDFVALQNGDTIEVFTTVVTGHRHALRVG